MKLDKESLLCANYTQQVSDRFQTHGSHKGFRGYFVTYWQHAEITRQCKQSVEDFSYFNSLNLR